MKDHILNSSSQHFTTSNNSLSGSPARLYVITGKGGVGKTTLAMALTKTLQNKGHKVLYNSFDTLPKYESIKDLDIPYFELLLEESMKEYMARKLKSEIIAKWIIKTPFFSSLINMIPSLSQMILLGHLVDKLRDDPKLHIVVDAPASGHAMSLFQSTHNFKDIFKEGMLVGDIDKMHSFLHASGNLEVWIATLSTKMAVQESLELGEKLKSLNISSIKYISNGNLSKVPFVQKKSNDLPFFLEKKVQMEQEALSEIELSEDSEIKAIPFFPELKFENIVRSTEAFLSKEGQ